MPKPFPRQAVNPWEGWSYPIFSMGYLASSRSSASPLQPKGMSKQGKRDTMQDFITDGPSSTHNCAPEPEHGIHAVAEPES